jgi:hypothetical protein
MQDYFDIAAVNFSTLKYMKKSPLHYKHARDVGREDSTNLLKGRAVHTAVLEPDQFDQRYAIYTGKTRRGKEWEKFELDHAGQEILKVVEREQAFAMRDAVLRHPAAKKIFASGLAEQTLVWTDESTGLLCKAKADWLTSIVLADLKSTPDVDGRRFGAMAARMDYFVQLAWYLDAARRAGFGVSEAKIVAVEVAAPYDVAVFTLSDDDLLAGRETYRGWLGQVIECIERDEWLGRYPDEQPLSLPKYVFDDEDQDDDSMIIVTDENEEDETA